MRTPTYNHKLSGLAFFVLLAIITGLAYFGLIRFLLDRWERIPEWQLPPDFQPQTTVSVLIPARNEADNILNCLESLLRQQFPAHLLGIIVIDDHSTDDTARIVRELAHPQVRLLRPDGPGGGKKNALSHGIRHAKGEWILTTDADCLLPPHWIAAFVAYIQLHDPVFITGPVVFTYEPQPLERFQALDMLGTMLITGSGIQSDTIYMSNGANLAYPRAVFLEVGGFSGIDHLASGDDMLLMHKIKEQYPGRIAFLKSPLATVLTPAVSTWRAFVQQRLRWGTKSGTYQDKKIIVVLALVFFLCWGILLSPVLVIFYGWMGLLPGLILLGGKIIADRQLLGRAARYFQREALMRHFWPSQLLHILYIAGIGLLANLVRRYEWKGRKLR